MMPAVRTVGPRKLRLLQGSPEWLEARRSLITATDVAVIEGVNPWRCEQDLADEKLTGNGVESSLVMRVGGFGDVPAVLDPETKQFHWQVNRRLRDEVCQVSVSWKGSDKKTAAPVVRWTFTIDKEAAYQPNGG
jgi:hypothetical protein